MADLRSTANVLNELLDLHAEQRPDDDAVTDGTMHLTWREYRDRTASLGGALREAGVDRGDRVAIHLPKSVDSFVAVHSILRLGAIVVPVDWFAPAAHVRDVIVDADVTAVISSAPERLPDGLGGGDGAGPDGAGDGAGPDGVGAGAGPGMIGPMATGPAIERVDVAPADDAYIVYTSGSTGRPKGIVHTNASALAYAAAAVDVYELTRTDRLANVAPLHFDQSTFELYAAPLAGAAVVVLSDVVLRFPASAAQLLERERVTVWYSVPFAISQLTGRGAVADRDLSALRWVLYGGESFPPRALAESMRALAGARFSNVYGPAEVNQCTFHHVADPPEGDDPVPIGRAMPAADLALVDDTGAPVDDDTPGHLLVSADTMMDRYWRRDDLTSAAIVTMPDPEAHLDSDTDLDSGDCADPDHAAGVEGVGGATSRRWYRTGDRVVRRADGEFVFLGRFDHQVKVRGHRIELEAIEAAAVEHAQVTDCAAMVERGVDGGDDRLVAAIAPHADDATIAEVVGHLRARLPGYAVPADIVGLAVIPRTGNGKIDRPAAADAVATRFLELRSGPTDRPH